MTGLSFWQMLANLSSIFALMGVGPSFRLGNKKISILTSSAHNKLTFSEAAEAIAAVLEGKMGDIVIGDVDINISTWS